VPGAIEGEKMPNHVVRHVLLAWKFLRQNLHRVTVWWRGLTEPQRRYLSWRSGLYLNLLAFLLALVIALKMQARVDAATEAARYYEAVSRDHQSTIQHAQTLEAIAVLIGFGGGQSRQRDLAEIRSKALISRFLSADRPADLAEQMCPSCPHTRNVGTLQAAWEELLVQDPKVFDSMREQLTDASTVRYFRNENMLRDAVVALSRWTLLRNTCAGAYICVQGLAILASSRADRPDD
jgi:hypothetical protein